MPKPPKHWVYSPRKPTPPPVPMALKTEVTTKANALIEAELKPKYVQPAPENPQFNYIVDVYGKWFHSAFYFCATYHVRGPNAITPSFEEKFARMQYAGNQRFHLAFMRYTGQWIDELYHDVTVDECLAAVRDDSYFSV